MEFEDAGLSSQTQTEVNLVLDAALDIAKHHIRDGRPLPPFGVWFRQRGDVGEVELITADEIGEVALTSADEVIEKAKAEIGQLHAVALVQRQELDDKGPCICVEIEHHDGVAWMILVPFKTGLLRTPRYSHPITTRGKAKIWT